MPMLMTMWQQQLYVLLYWQAKMTEITILTPLSNLNQASKYFTIASL